MRGARTGLAIVLALMTMLIGGSAAAAEITYSFTAEITNTLGSVPFDEGDLVLGTFTYTTDLLEKSSSSSQTTYDGSGILTMAIAGFTPGGSLNELIVQDASTDRFTLRSSSIFDSTILELEDSSGSAFSSQDIPTALPLSAFDSATFELDFAGFGFFSGDIISTSILAPEPGTGTLMALGLAGLAARRRRG